MPYIHICLSQGDRVQRPVGGSRVVLGTVSSVSWESTTGGRYFILWDGSAVARRYTREQLRQQGIRRVGESTGPAGG
ncbi:hypothetical protein ACGRHY_28875 [Streptomyces sp. HK10]|uniref:hypothetical protein n=1 Tax=Streptomyces sp. HK10 TaxID=3373255 RepID=UPI00374A01FA